jgi:hypothetical protein
MRWMWRWNNGVSANIGTGYAHHVQRATATICGHFINVSPMFWCLYSLARSSFILIIRLGGLRRIALGIWCNHYSDYQDYRLLGYDAMYYFSQVSDFRRKSLLPSSGESNKQRRKRNKKSRIRTRLNVNQWDPCKMNPMASTFKCLLSSM